MKRFYIDEKELADLLRLAYKEGVYGYLDLADSVVERIVSTHALKEVPPPNGPPLGTRWENFIVSSGNSFGVGDTQQHMTSIVTGTGQLLSGDIEMDMAQLIRNSETF